MNFQIYSLKPFAFTFALLSVSWISLKINELLNSHFTAFCFTYDPLITFLFNKLLEKFWPFSQTMMFNVYKLSDIWPQARRHHLWLPLHQRHHQQLPGWGPQQVRSNQQSIRGLYSNFWPMTGQCWVLVAGLASSSSWQHLASWHSSSLASFLVKTFFSGCFWLWQGALETLNEIAIHFS